MNGRHHANNNSTMPQQQRQQQQQPLCSHEGQPLISTTTTKFPHHYNNNHDHDHEVFDDTDESEIERRHAFRGMTLTAVLLVGILIFLRYATTWFFAIDDDRQQRQVDGMDDATTTCPEPNIPFCQELLLLEEDHKYHVSRNRVGFPSFWNYAPRGPMNVSYDGRSFFINGDRALFLSGSMHPIRATKQTWDYALDEAVKHGLNMITIYVTWAEHQRFPNQTMDWTLMAGRGKDCLVAKTRPSYCGWELADAIRAAAKRGLFVHARIGPYVCAEYSYGGIPEWVALHNPNMIMRRLNEDWLDAMEAYVTSTVNYLAQNKLFAHQGGPIIMAQIENELGEENDDLSDIPIIVDDNNLLRAEATATTTADNDGDDIEGRDLRILRSLKSGTSTTSNNNDDNNGKENGSSSSKVDEDSSSSSSTIDDDVERTQQVTPTVQDYADWCGSLVKRLQPNVTWTMCNGLSAKNTIATCNGDCSAEWLENHGTSGRIQVDQPAIWSEDEGGFQIWGDEPTHPSDYFWGRTARAMAYDALRWFARGGTHLNYYMWWGGYNRGRASAAGIMNAYATDAPVCASGQRRQPKFGHFQELHLAIQRVASILLEAPTALNQQIEVEHMTEDGEWAISGEQRMFVYNTNHSLKENKEVVIVENDSKSFVVVKLLLGVGKQETLTIEMGPKSAMLIKDGSIKFDSFNIRAKAMAYERRLQADPTTILGWSSCAEAIGASMSETKVVVQSKPVEQTALNIDAGVSSDYAWYDTTFNLDAKVDEASIFVESQKGSAMVLFIDGAFQGEAYNRYHAEGNETFEFHVGRLDEGHHTLAILSESLGYHNLIGRWGASTKAKVKGITGDVIIASKSGNQSLVHVESQWKSSPGLNGGETGLCRGVLITAAQSESPRPHWSTAMFNTPAYDPAYQALYLNITKGRGHFWLNGHNMGRFWNITRGDSDKFSQQYYFLPADYLESNGSINKIVFFDALGGDLSSTRLVLSWLEKTDFPNFQDEVDFPLACI